MPPPARVRPPLPPAPIDASAGAIEGLDPLRLPAGRLLRRGPGRRTELVELGPGRAVVVKRYGGGARRAATAGREAAALRALRRLGVPAAEPLGWSVRGGSGALALRLVRHAETARELLARGTPSARTAVGAELAGHVARMHSAGWVHRDLYLEHWLVDVEAGERLVLIDGERLRRRRRTRRRWLVKDVAALLHSTPPEVAPRERLRFLARYLDLCRVLGRRRRRAFARAVQAKARRMAAHVPRHGESFPLPEEWRG